MARLAVLLCWLGVQAYLSPTLSKSQGSHPLEKILREANNIEELAEDGPDTFQCSSDGRDLFMSLEGNGLDWGAAVCGPASETEFVAKTRADAQAVCKSRWGTPDLVVDGHQACTCCPIKCAGAPYGDPALEGKLGAEAKAICEDSIWGGNLAHLQLSAHRGCHCKCKTGATAGQNLWTHKDQCEKEWSGSFQSCNECHCQNHTAGDKSLQQKKNTCENVEKGKFVPQGCNCMCKNSPDKNLNEEKEKCSTRGHTFDPTTCSCVCGATTCSQSPNTLVSTARSACEAVPGQLFSDDNGICACKCGTAGSFYEGKNYSHPFENELICDAQTKCSDKGGSMNASNPCNCQCAYAGAITNVDAAKASCGAEVGALTLSGEDNNGGHFLLSEKKCSCMCHPTDSEEGFRTKSITDARKFCPEPQMLRIKSNKGCNCLCPGATPETPETNISLVSEKQEFCEKTLSHPGKFLNRTCACNPTPQTPNRTCQNAPNCCDDPCHEQDGTVLNHDQCKDKCLVGFSGEGGGGGLWDTSGDPWRCLCKAKGAESALSPKKDLYCAKDTCETAKNGFFDADGCNCMCAPSEKRHLFWDKEEESCLQEGGLFDGPNCDCKCQAYSAGTGLETQGVSAVWHGNRSPDGKNLVKDAKHACSGKFYVTDATCVCEPLASEPCCSDGSGTLISQARSKCAACGGHLEGNQDECRCSVDPCVAPSPTPTPTPEATPETPVEETPTDSSSTTEGGGSSITAGSTDGSIAGSQEDKLDVKSCRHQSFTDATKSKSPNGKYCADTSNSPNAQLATCTTWESGGGGFYLSTKPCDQDVTYPDKVDVQTDYKAAQGVYAGQGLHNGRTKYQHPSGATLKYETVKAAEWGATSWLKGDGWVIITEGVYRYGIRTIADIGELTAMTEWSTRNSATNPVKVIAVDAGTDAPATEAPATEDPATSVASGCMNTASTKHRGLTHEFCFVPKADGHCDLENKAEPGKFASMRAQNHAYDTKCKDEGMTFTRNAFDATLQPGTNMPGGEFTVALVLKHDSNTDTVSREFWQSNRLILNSEPFPKARVEANGPKGRRFVTFDNVYSMEEFVQVVVTVHEVEGIKMYKNGQPLSPMAGSDPNWASGVNAGPSDYTRIGHNHFAGVIKSVAMWTKALSPDEVAGLSPQAAVSLALSASAADLENDINQIVES